MTSAELAAKHLELRKQAFEALVEVVPARVLATDTKTASEDPSIARHLTRP